MKELQELAERLENKKLVGLKLTLFGFALGGLFRIIDAHFISVSGNTTFLILQIIGGVIFLMGLSQLILVGIKVRRDSLLKQLFNDELSAQTRMKTWKAGFIAVVVTQTVFIAISSFQPYGALMAAEITIYVAFCASVGAGLIEEELLAINFFYPDFDEEKYEVWNWRKFSFFHWIVNPGIAINELLIGQRVPKVMLIDKQSDKAWMERSYTPCPHCGTVHQNAVWSKKNKNLFGNWYGLYCPDCGGVIPCLSNIFTRIIRIITYPLWFWKKDDLKARWIEKQKLKSQNLDLTPMTHDEVNWKKIGFKFGAWMFIFMTIFFQGFLYFFDEGKLKGEIPFFDLRFILINLVVWSLAGWGFSAFLKYYSGRKGQKAGADTQKQTV